MEDEELYGNNAIDYNSDFSTMKELKESINNFFENYDCPSCGGHRMEGGIIVEIGISKFFHEVYKKKFWGGEELITKNFKDVWRIGSTYLKPSSFLNSAGRIYCKSCGWEEKGAKGIRWLSMHDIKNGNF
jgi:predicted nucleic-acid-binding Zn-ribbon protein